MTCKVGKMDNTFFCIWGRGWIKRCMGNVGIAQTGHYQLCRGVADLLDPVLQSLTVDIGSQNILMTLKDNGNDWSLIINLLWIYPSSVPSIFSIRLTGIAGRANRVQNQMSANKYCREISLDICSWLRSVGGYETTHTYGAAFKMIFRIQKWFV